MEIKTLISDIANTVQTNGGWNQELFQQFGSLNQNMLQKRFAGEERKPTLRMSRLGPMCPKALWYSIYHPELAEKLQPWAVVKFMFGDMIENLGIILAKASGHDVRGEQDELYLDDITGHRDCVIDGCIVDVKSSSTLSFSKFKDGTLEQSDSFGYLDQLDSYVVASREDPLVTVKDRGYILAIDKQLGHMALYEHRIREDRIRERIKLYKEIVARSTAPTCTCGTVADGSSGNIKLDTKASYSSFKHVCFPGLRTFLYARGPVYLTKVVRRPYDPVKKVYIPEVDRYGNTVY